jgi:hypothetical protein
MVGLGKDTCQSRFLEGLLALHHAIETGKVGLDAAEMVTKLDLTINGTDWAIEFRVPKRAARLQVMVATEPANVRLRCELPDGTSVTCSPCAMAQK